MRTRTLNDRILLASLAALAAVLIFSGTLGFGFVWDDIHIIGFLQKSAAKGGAGALVTSEYALPAMSTGYYRPVTSLLTWLIAFAAPGSPFAFHLASVLLHALATALLFLLLDCLLPSRTGAFLGSLLFALHPVHVESVAMVSNRSEPLAACFLLAASLFWMDGRQSGSARPGRGNVLLGGGTFLLAILSKETSFLLPAALLAWDLVLPGKAGATTGLPPLRSWWNRNRSWLLAWGLAAGMALILRWGIAGIGLGNLGKAGGTSHVPAGLRGPSLFLSMGMTYLKLLAVPWPLNAYYTPHGLTLAPVAVSGAFLTLLVLAAAIFLGRPRYGVPALAWMAVFLLPVSGIVPIGGAIVAERYLYIPSMGFCLAVGTLLGLALANNRLRAAVATLFALLLVLFAAGTVSRTRVWRNEVVLFADITRTSPDASLGWFNLANHHRRQGDLAQAETMYRRALAAYPGHVDAMVNLGIILDGRGRSEDAIILYRRALSLSPGNVIALQNLGTAFLRLSRFEEAVETFRQATSKAPDEPDLFYLLGYALLSSKQNQEALQALSRSVSLAPSSARNWAYLGKAYGNLGRWPEAEESLEKALALEPMDSTAIQFLFAVYVKWGLRDKAAGQLRTLERLDRDAAERLRPFLAGKAAENR